MDVGPLIPSESSWWPTDTSVQGLPSPHPKKPPHKSCVLASSHFPRSPSPSLGLLSQLCTPGPPGFSPGVSTLQYRWATCLRALRPSPVAPVLPQHAVGQEGSSPLPDGVSRQDRCACTPVRAEKHLSSTQTWLISPRNLSEGPGPDHRPPGGHFCFLTPMSGVRGSHNVQAASCVQSQEVC